MKWNLLLAFCFAWIAPVAFAVDGSSGCGPGWYVAKENSLLSSSIRGTTNGLLAPTVTLGMTFGTSNCQKHSIVKNEQESLKFATENYFELAVDSSRGNGEFLTAFAETFGCKNFSQQIFNQEMQKYFQQLFPVQEVVPEQLLKQTYMIILKNQTLQQACFSA